MTGRIWLWGCCGVGILTIMLFPDLAKAEANTLEQGELSLGLYQVIAPYNRYWYHYGGPTECNGSPCSRLNFNSYDSLQVPEIGGQSAAMEDSLLATTGIRAEFGVLKRLTVVAESQLAYTKPQEPGVSLGDTWLGARWRAAGSSQLVVSFSGALKIPGTYSPYSLAAPGGGQPDLETKVLVGGALMRRKLVYDLGFGYRIRVPYSNPGQVSIAPLHYESDLDTSGDVLESEATRWAINGPADEVFADFSIGYFVSRTLFLYLNGGLVNTVKGISVDDYFLTVARAEEQDTLGRSQYQVTGDPEELLSILEEDFVRLGGGILLKLLYRTTVYANYSMTVIGQNTPAFYVSEGSRFPLGSITFGVEYTFGTRKTRGNTPLAEAPDLSQTVLARSLHSAGGPSH